MKHSLSPNCYFCNYEFGLLEERYVVQRGYKFKRKEVIGHACDECAKTETLKIILENKHDW